MRSVNADTTDGRPGASPEAMQAIDPIVRAKYLDYCSAQISEVFLSLTDERIYELVEEAAKEAELRVGSLSFQEMMRLVTRKLQVSIPLPDLGSWATDYERDPARYDPYLLGLWQSAVEDGSGTSEDR